MIAERTPRSRVPAWPQATLDDVLIRLSNGLTKRQTKDGKGMPVTRIETISQGVVDMGRVGYLEGVSEKERHQFQLEPGDLLFSHINSDLHLGKTAIFRKQREPVLHGMNLLLMRSDSSLVLPEWLHWLFNLYRHNGYFSSIAQHAVNQSSINQAKLKRVIVPLPSLLEQGEIVAHIEEQFSRLDAGVEALKRAQANLKRYRASVLKAACEGRLVLTEVELSKLHNPQSTIENGESLLARILEERRRTWTGKGKYKEPTAPDASNLPELPEGWTWASLDQVGQEGRPIIYGIIKPGPHDPDGVPYVRVTEMKTGVIDVKALRKASRERAAKFARATLRAGDVLISKDGTIGKVAVVPPDLEGGNITQHVMRAPVCESVSRMYVVWAIRSEFCQKWLTRETKGVALQGVNVEDFRVLPLPLPPLLEQERIVAEVERRLSVADALEATLNATLRRATRLRQAVLQKAFSSGAP